jgi:hypothetical protein
MRRAWRPPAIDRAPNSFTSPIDRGEFQCRSSSTSSHRVPAGTGTLQQPDQIVLENRKRALESIQQPSRKNLVGRALADALALFIDDLAAAHDVPYSDEKRIFS